jgi:predicted DNA-binding protein
MKHEHDRVLTEQLVVRLPPELRALLEAQAAKDDRTMANLVRRLIARGLQADQPEAAA